MAAPAPRWRNLRRGRCINASKLARAADHSSIALLRHKRRLLNRHPEGARATRSLSKSKAWNARASKDDSPDRASRRHPSRLARKRSLAPQDDGARSVRFPRNDDALELVEGEREQEADDRDHEQPDIHLLYRERAPGAPDQVTQPALCADHFGHRDQHEPDADAQLEPGHDHRQGAWERNGPESAPAARLVVSSDVQ